MPQTSHADRGPKAPGVDVVTQNSDQRSRGAWVVPVLVAVITALGAITVALINTGFDLGGLFGGETAPTQSESSAPEPRAEPVDIGGEYYLDPGSPRILVLTPAGEGSYTIEEKLPASWPFKGTVTWVSGVRFDGPATFASGTTMRVSIVQNTDGTLATMFDYVSDDDGNPIERIDTHTLVPIG